MVTHHEYSGLTDSLEKDELDWKQSAIRAAHLALTNYALTHGYSFKWWRTVVNVYVREVKDNWPESGCFRKTVEIDDALELMKSRLEFYTVLMEKGIHLMSRTDSRCTMTECNTQSR
jgi:hypothetical protein